MHVGLEFLSSMHHIVVGWETNRYFNRDIVRWMEAMNIVRRIHRLPEDHFPTFPNHLPFRLFSKLMEVFGSSSSADCDAFYQYLDPLKEYWRDTFGIPRGAVVMLLADHINNYPQSNPESHSSLDGWTVSPFVMSSSGMELIAFVDKQFEEDPGLKGYMSQSWNKDEKEAWIEAMERVRRARRLYEAVRIDPEHSDGTPLPFKPNAGADEDFIEARDGAGVDEVDHDNEKIGPSKTESSRDSGGVAGVRSFNESGINEEKESEISEPDGSEWGQDDHDLGQKEVGGPGADKNM
ncbi:hypothetical protein AAF712_009452 [Marasmius tenuissimus]|uniref:Uncharacterized protein n=1 Tax=Marasmius tenuissimus TaxID=585030 RepID=A0ABR2ZQG2_9AGAR